MKTALLLLAALTFTSLTAEATVLPASSFATETTVSTESAASTDQGLFKRKKYKHKKRRHGNRTRYHRGGLFGR